MQYFEHMNDGRTARIIHLGLSASKPLTFEWAQGAGCRVEVAATMEVLGDELGIGVVAATVRLLGAGLGIDGRMVRELTVARGRGGGLLVTVIAMPQIALTSGVDASVR
jgi:hypothetical protein